MTKAELEKLIDRLGEEIDKRDVVIAGQRRELDLIGTLENQLKHFRKEYRSLQAKSRESRRNLEAVRLLLESGFTVAALKVLAS